MQNRISRRTRRESSGNNVQDTFKGLAYKKAAAGLRTALLVSNANGGSFGAFFLCLGGIALQFSAPQ
jgi:hypothetical protein